MRSRFPHGGDVLGAAPANPLLAPYPLLDRGLSMSRQRELLDLQAIQRISGLAGYWKSDPQYLFEDSAGTTPASTNGTGPIGRWNPVGYVEVLGPTLTANALDLSKWAAYGSNTVELDSDAIKITYVGGTNSSNGGYAYITRSTDSPSGIMPSLLTVGKTYRFYADCKVNAGSSVIVECAQTTSSYSQPVTSTDFITVAFDFVCSITTGVVRFGLSMGSGEIIWIKNIRVTEVISTLGAYQSTTANKPILRKTPTTGVYWADSNTSTSALNVALGNLGSACTVARSSAEGVTFTEGVTISSTYNIAPAFAFNSNVAIFNRALTATEKALITRYMARAVPMLGNNVVTNGTFDTDTTGWTTDAAGLITPVDGRLRIANNGGVHKAATQYSTPVSKSYLGKCEAKGDGTAFPRFLIGNTCYKDGTTATTLQSLSVVSHLSSVGGVSLMCRSTVTTGVYTEFDNVTAQEIL